MKTLHDDALNRVGALVRAEQTRKLADDRELRRLEAAAEGLTRHPRDRSRRAWLAGLGVLAAGLSAIVLVAVWPRGLSFHADGVVSSAGMKVAADLAQSLPLRFSDGSVLTLAPGSHGEVVELSTRGANVRLDSGQLEASVVHADRTRWAVGVGPYVVQVTGTRFLASWNGHRQRLMISLTEGSVTVQGPLLGGAGLPLKKGQALSIDVGEQRVSLAPLEDRTAPTIRPPAPSVAPEPEPLQEPSEWKRWALAANPKQAYAAAVRAGIDVLCRTLPPQDLLLLADAARFAGAAGSAQQVFRSLRARFPGDTRAGDAVFGLGILALDADGQPGIAVRRFEEYLTRWPAGALAREARGRLMEALDKAMQHQEARRAAARYVAKHPDGPHAAFARRLLERERR